MKLEYFMDNKNVLLIPVYSTRSYESGIYDLLADGNVSKFLMKILNSCPKNVDILYPKKSINILPIKEITQKYSKSNVNWIEFDYCKNAHETRNAGKLFYNFIVEKLNPYDLIISEIDTLAECAIKSNNSLCDKYNFIYWAGSWNADLTRWDNEKSAQRNKEIAKHLTTACLLKGQEELYGGKSFYDECEYYPFYFDKNIIFFPFRLSDNSYHAKEFIDAIKWLRLNGEKNFVVLFTDVNDSHIFDDKICDYFIKVPQNKFVYQAILKGRPIIPYLDDVSKNYHSNIYEFLYYKCDVIMLKNDLFPYTTQIKSVDDLKYALMNKIKR